MLFSGDLVTRGTQHVEEGVACLAMMNPRKGIFGCLDDHDIWSAPKRVADGLAAIGVKQVEGGRGIVVVGVTVITNVYSSRPDLVSETNGPEGDLVIMLTHQPSLNIVEFASESGYDLVLSGHTHEGQIGLNWFGYRLNSSSFETPYVSGFYRIGQTLLSVTNGLGLTLAPFRYLAPAEITLVELE